MKIYFTASTSVNGELTPFYRQIVAHIKSQSAIITSGEQIGDKKMLAEDKSLGSKQIFEREKKRMDESDLVIAEASKPSHGVGGEIVYALSVGKPVLALINTAFEDIISPMLVGNPSENLYIEYYDNDNLQRKIHDFITYIEKNKKRKGKLIVIDGGNGSGKTTQARLLVEHLKKEQILVKYVDFPQYYRSFHGKTVAKFLRGEFGKIDEVSPYLISLAFALDRASVKHEMDEFLAKGGIIIANRYATSSMAHQAAKCKTEKERADFLKWVYELEYKVHKIPKENIVIYLHVPYQLGIKLTEKRGTPAYLEGATQDIEEKDLNNRIQTEAMYLMLCKKYRHWKKIDCVKDGKLLPAQEIHKQILELLNSSV